MRCAAITKAGGHCRLEATHGSYCYQHSPETAERRRLAARRGGKNGGNGRGGISEIAAVKGELKDLIADVLCGSTGKSEAAVAIQGYNTLTRMIELERKLREQDELEERLGQLEEALSEGRQEGVRQWR